MTPLTISVITVCYNSGKTLRRSLESVAQQDWPSVEHIVVDGASTDNTAQILEEFRPKLASIISENDTGIYNAMNKGLALARGDVVAFLNADDFYANSRILRDVANSITKDSLQILMGDVAYFKEGNPERIIRRYRSNIFSPDKLRKGLMPAHPALFISRRVLQKTGGFRENYKIAGDFELIARIFTKQSLRLGYLPQVLVNMQIGGVSTSGWQAKILINREILQACKENGIKTNIFHIFLRYPKKLAELTWFRAK